MTFASFGTSSQATTAENQLVVNQAEIEREIVKLHEDSARDVQRQLEQQRLATKEGRVKEDVKKVVEGVEEGVGPAWKAAEQDVETIVKDAEADVKAVRRHGERGEKGERQG